MFQSIQNNDLVKGILIGAGVRRNVPELGDDLRRHGIQVKTPGRSFETMSIEDLMRTKEDIEDLIAEKELQDQSVTVRRNPPRHRQSDSFLVSMRALIRQIVAQWQDKAGRRKCFDFLRPAFFFWLRSGGK